MANDANSPSSRAARPQFTNIHISQILTYKLPLAGIISILHRVSGAAMFLVGIPLMLYIFELSLTSEISYDKLTKFTGSWFIKLILLGFIWSFAHHFFCGIRYLMLDMHKGLEKGQAKTSAMVVMVCSLLATFVFGLKLFGAF